MRRIIVCVKAVPDPKEAEKIKIDPVTKAIPRSEIALVINPLDQNALEAALRIKEREGGHISVVSMGPPPAANIVKECLALGADEGILISDPAFAGADAYATAFTLSQAIKKVGNIDIVFCGMASSDGATEWVGPELATFLDFPVVTMVRELSETSGDVWKVKADYENGYRLVKVKLPAVFTVTRELNIPRKLSFSGIIKARKKEITTWNLADLALDDDEVGLSGSPTIVSKQESLEIKRQVTWIEGTLDEKVDQLIQILTSAGADL
jgi:electron transfer flavoprotein beta subunit